MVELTNPAAQDYLKTIYLIGQTAPQRRILTSEIADRLSLRPASVTGMLGRLATEGLVDYKKRYGVRLTPEGERIALAMVRRHRLIETFLVEKLGYSWDEVHDEAERLEHAVTAAFCQRVAEILNHPTTDPHGAPIPGIELERPVVTHTRLNSLKPGDRAKIARLSDRDPQLLQDAADYGLRPGAIVEVMVGPELRLRLEGSESIQKIEKSLGEIVYVSYLEPQQG